MKNIVQNCTLLFKDDEFDEQNSDEEDDEEKESLPPVPPVSINMTTQENWKANIQFVNVEIILFILVSKSLYIFTEIWF